MLININQLERILSQLKVAKIEEDYAKYDVVEDHIYTSFSNNDFYKVHTLMFKKLNKYGDYYEWGLIL